MKAINLFVFIIFCFISSSCRSQSSNMTEVGLKKCINESVNNNTKEIFGKNHFDFYDFMLEIENIMIANKMLGNRSREGYLDLFENINKINNDDYKWEYQEFVRLMDDKGFGYNHFVIQDAIFNQCPYKVSVDDKSGEGKFIYAQGTILNKLMKQGYDNRKLLRKLIHSMDERNFDKIVYRAPVIFLVMINLNWKYNPAYEKLEENKKDRK